MDQIHGELSGVETIEGQLASMDTIEGSLQSVEEVSGTLSVPPSVGSAGNVFFHTTAEWNSMSGYVSRYGVIYVYTDYKLNEDGQYEAGFKTGDGTTYLIDLPFTDETMRRHIDDTTIHITQAEREFWNSKVRAIGESETLILTQH